MSIKSPLEVEQKPNLLVPTLSALAACIFGSAIWGTITALSGYNLGVIAILLGVFVGIAVRKTSNQQHFYFAVMASVIALLGCIVGEYFGTVGYIAKNYHLTFMYVLRTMDMKTYLEISKAGFSIMNIIFYVLAIQAAFRLNKVSGIKAITPQMKTVEEKENL